MSGDWRRDAKEFFLQIFRAKKDQLGDSPPIDQIRKMLDETEQRGVSLAALGDMSPERAAEVAQITRQAAEEVFDVDLSQRKTFH